MEHIRTITIVVDNCRTPSRSLLQGIRTRQMMERRWMPSLCGDQRQSPNSQLSNRSSAATSFPRVPKRQITPPHQKREEVSSLSNQDAAAASVPALTNDTPNLPVRKNSILAEAREQIGESSGTSEMDQTAALPPTPMKQRSFRRRLSSVDLPQMPKRKNSLPTSTDLNEDDGGLEGMERDPQTIGELRRRVSETRRPNLPRRKSSFEILPATLPSRQSSFELRQRINASADANPESEVLIHSADQRLNQSSRLHLPTKTLAGEKESEHNFSRLILPGCSSNDHELATKTKKTKTNEAEQNAKPRVKDKNEGDKIMEAKRNSSSLSDKIEQRIRAVQAFAQRPERTSFRRQLSIDSTSSCDSTGSGGVKARFRRYRRAAPSLPVRHSSFELARKEGRQSGRLPGRQSSFPGLYSSFQHL